MSTDSFGRTVDYLRVSVTDRCNLRCGYCMPPEGIPLLSRRRILSYEEIERFVSIGVGEGLVKVRLTGGEPLLRRGIVDHVRRLRAIPGLRGIALTTNGTLLAPLARELAQAGIDRVNISIDSLDPTRYERLTCGGVLTDALAGVDAALDAGLDPVKINVVVHDGDQDLRAFAELSRSRPLHVRFIERMSVGPDAAPIDAEPLISQLEAAGVGPLEPLTARAAPSGWGPARSFRLPEAKGTIGVITGESDDFCETCSRLRLSADGHLRPCLFGADDIDVRRVLRHGSDSDVARSIRDAIAARPQGRCLQCGTERHMSQIGG